MTRAPLRPHLLLAALVAAPFSSAQTLRTPYHGASDTVAHAGKAVLLEAWFSRSAGIQKAVEHAEVRVEIQRGDTWVPLGQARTDGEGRAVLAFQAPAALGAHALRWRLTKAAGADALETVEATLHVMAAGTEVTVFDIDGTLTGSDSENFKDYARRLIRHPSTEGPVFRAGAVEAVRRAASLGPVVYLSGRAPWLARPTREWLSRHGFPPGVVLLMPESRDILPTESRVGRAKIERLKALKALGLGFRAAYGNAMTDIHAYAALGIDPRRTFILGKHGGKEGTVALGECFPAE